MLPANIISPAIIQILGSLGLYKRSLHHPQFSVIISSPVLYIIVVSSGLCSLTLEISQIRRYPNVLKDLLD